MSSSQLVNVTFKKKFLEDFDKWWQQKGYDSRAEAVRDACRQKMSENHLRRNND